MNVIEKKKILAINLGNFGSTGGIMSDVCNIAEENGYIAYKAYPSNPQNKPKENRDIIIANDLLLRVSKSLSYKTGYNGCFSFISTILFLRKVRSINPDIIHLHNLHNSYINLFLLFAYLKKYKPKVIWTLHDCWAFTGGCPHFTMIGCERWKTGCGDCPQLNAYPAVRKDRTTVLWKLKKKWFNGVDDLTIVTPSYWLSKQVERSFLKDYSRCVIYNGIDLDSFKPTHVDLRGRYNIKSKYIITGVAFDWSDKKGLDVFIKLSADLGKDFTIILVGTSMLIDKKLPSNIVSIHKTRNKKQMAAIYTESDLFVNPTKEEVLGLVNLEALACGTPVVMYDTGGCSETITKDTGVSIKYNDYNELLREIRRVCEEKTFNAEDCIKWAQKWDKKKWYKTYLKLF